MFDKEVVCLEIGSSKLRVIVASVGVNNTLLVKELAQTQYDGYFQGEFVEPKQLSPSLFELLKSIDYHKKHYDKKIYIALPSEMTKVANVVSSLSIERIGKVTKGDIEALKYNATSKALDGECEIVSATPIKFSVDEHNYSNPVGIKGRNLSGEFSIISCPKNLIEMLNDVCGSLGYECVEYLSEALCQAQMLIGDEDRRDGAILIDVGNLSTYVAHIKNDGIMALTSFSIGGGHITSDLCDAFELSFEDAEKLKKQIVISVEAGPLDYYDLSTTEGKIEKIPQQDACKVVAYRLQVIASAINQCLIMQGVNLANYIPIYLTGAGVARLKGGKDFLAKCLSRNITYGLSNLPGKDKPEDGVIYAIAEFALKNC